MDGESKEGSGDQSGFRRPSGQPETIPIKTHFKLSDRLKNWFKKPTDTHSSEQVVDRAVNDNQLTAKEGEELKDEILDK